jgi:hypothetical protein
LALLDGSNLKHAMNPAGGGVGETYRSNEIDSTTAEISARSSAVA